MMELFFPEKYIVLKFVFLFEEKYFPLTNIVSNQPSLLCITCCPGRCSAAPQNPPFGCVLSCFAGGAAENANALFCIFFAFSTFQRICNFCIFFAFYAFFFELGFAFFFCIFAPTSNIFSSILHSFYNFLPTKSFFFHGKRCFP